jgi:hypothetical protein
MQLYKQGDPRWALKKLGASNWNMAQKGCVTTDVTMSADYFGIKMTPGQVVEKLSYTNTGLLLWPSVKKHWSSIRMAWVWLQPSYYRRSPKKTLSVHVFFR